MRTHVALPEDLLSDVDELAGPRGRSKFIEDAVRVKVQREKLGRALEKYAGFLDPADHPEWSTPEAISQWVRDLRKVDNDRLEEHLARWHHDEE